ncbi:MAG: hypothetical protein KIT84_22780 [Labilithrix sp.]|nr:hypothetical protein [Labilithrix sp.]MCW5813871.1 hypothetical protein [Labilithrix sp.]
MKRGLALAAAALVVGASACSRYEDNDLELLTVYSAKMTCSCVFVMKRDDAYCREWAREVPNVRTLTIDHEKKRVEAQAIGFWGAKARYVDARRGCVVE